MFNLLKHKCFPFDEIFIMGCIKNCDWFSQWEKFPQYDDISVSVLIDNGIAIFDTCVFAEMEMPFLWLP